MNRVNLWNTRSLALGLGLVSVMFAVGAVAQVQTDTSVSHGASTRQVQVEKATVVSVNGNDLIVKMADGTIRDFPNVPESTRVNVDGKQLGIHDLQPGMTLRRTITTTTTPKVITTTKSVTGTVWYVQPPNSVILTMEDGKNQEFKIPKGQKFNVNGQMTDAWGLKKGMQISATQVVEEPVTVVAQQRKLTGTMPPPPPPPPPDVPILVVVLRPVPPPAPVETAAAAPTPAPTTLPKTASELPLLGLIGVISLLSGASLRMRRRLS